MVSSTLDIESLLVEHGPLIGRVAATYEAVPAIRDELIQEIALAVWRALESFRGDASLKTFIAKVAHNRCVDHVLKESKRQETPSEIMAMERSDEARPAAMMDAAFDLMTALRQLNLNYRQVMALQLEGFSHREIGEALGIEEAAVSQRASRARQQLEQIMKREP